MMLRFAVGGCVLVFGMLTSAFATDAELDARSLPMRFELRREGPAHNCNKQCRVWVSASGTIVSDTPRDFERFAQGRNLRGATIALDSDGGSVIGALELGRSIRRLGMNTTVGKSIDVSEAGMTGRRSRLDARAACGSMCTFVLLAGVARDVPAQARVLVHQIWLGDRRDDPTAATYSAEDLVLVQRDIGRLAQYTMEMIGSIDLLDVTLKIPPWEPMYELSRNELQDMKLVTADAGAKGRTVVSAKTAAPVATGARAVIGARTWSVSDSGGAPILSRRHPLTIYGEEIGTFDLALSCGAGVDQYTITYLETRTGANTGRIPQSLKDVELTLAGKTVPLKVTSSRAKENTTERNSVAIANVPASLIKTFAEVGNNSLTVETSSFDKSATVITLGNAGFARSLPQLVASCNQAIARDKAPAERGGAQIDTASVRSTAQ